MWDWITTTNGKGGGTTDHHRLVTPPLLPPLPTVLRVQSAVVALEQELLTGTLSMVRGVGRGGGQIMRFT